MSSNNMKFSEHYNPDQQAMVAKINAELGGRGLEPLDAGIHFASNSAVAILAGKANFDLGKQLTTMWESLFGTASVSDIASDNTKFADSYNKEDRALCAQIKLRLCCDELKRQNVTGSSIASSMSITPGAYSQIINGKYKASPTKHLHEIWSLISPVTVNGIETDVEASPNRKVIRIRYGEIPFIKTSISGLMAVACDQARDRRRFSVFAGQAGLGKTVGLTEYCKNNEGAILIMGSEQTSSGQILEQLCRKLGLPKASSAAKNMDKIIYALRDSDRLIILDEADKCKPNALDPLRTISDNARVGVTLVGNNQLVDKLKSQERFELIASRVCFWPKPTGQVTVEDIKTLFSELTQDSLTLADTSDKWWIWLHKRVEGNARELVENLLPHLLKFTSQGKGKGKKIDRLLVNSIFSTVLNKPAV